MISCGMGHPVGALSRTLLLIVPSRRYGSRLAVGVLGLWLVVNGFDLG
jgi:hypothetical protein